MPTWKCPRCLMTFRLEECADAEHTRCTDCDLRFWHIVRYGDLEMVRVGIEPEDARAEGLIQ